jgi:maleylacetate reductase
VNLPAELSFVHDQRAVQVVFGAGTSRQLAGELDHLGPRRVALIGSARYAGAAEALLGARSALRIDNPLIHTPREQIDEVHTRAVEAGVDGAVAVGGGSAIGLAKALALRMRIPVLAVPTTFSGSEMTRVWGVTDEGVKTTGKDVIVAPRTVIYDPDLVATLPARTAVPSAFNAVAHAVEALYAPDRTPVADLLAKEAVRTVCTALPGLAEGRPDAAGKVLYGAWLSGMCLDSTMMGLHHKLCHVLGGTLGLPHAQTHTVVLPHVLAFNAAGAPGAVAALREALEAAEPWTALHDLIAVTGAPRALRELGMREEDIDRVVDVVLAAPYANPTPVDGAGLRALLVRAWAGAPPRTDA